MLDALSPPLAAKSGHTLQVLGICRVSDPREGKQDIRSLADQETLLRSWVRQRTDLPVEVKIIAGTGSGEIVDRPEVDQAEREVKFGCYDLVVTEDLGRFLRRMQASMFCELAEDFNTRVIAINDRVDTAQDGWRLNAFFASFRHELYNADTAQRIRRAHRSRFQHGGVFQCQIFGYSKAPDARTDQDVSKEPAAEAIYEEWFQRLEAGQSFAEVADWLNSTGVPTGPYTRNDQWTSTIVGRTTRNPILKGLRVRNDKMAKRVSSGRRKCVKAPPEERLERHCPHLQFIEPERFDRVIAMLDDRNACYRRADSPYEDSRNGVPRKRTRYPGQCIYCGVCGRMFVFGGHGQTDHLMCDGARQHLCWNGATVDGPLAAGKISAAIYRELETLIGYDAEFMAGINAEVDRLDQDKEQRLREIAQKLNETSQAIERLLSLVMGGQMIPSVNEKLEELEAKKQTLLREQERLQRRRTNNIQLPPIDELKQLACEKMASLAIDGFEFAAFVRQLTPRIVVLPVRLLDGGKVVLRAHFNLQLAELLPDADSRDAARPSLLRELCIDLFDDPQREAVRPQVVAARARGDAERKIAASLGVTITAALVATAHGRSRRQRRVRAAADASRRGQDAASSPSALPLLAVARRRLAVAVVAPCFFFRRPCVRSRRGLFMWRQNLRTLPMQHPNELPNSRRELIRKIMARTAQAVVEELRQRDEQERTERRRRRRVRRKTQSTGNCDEAPPDLPTQAH